MALLRKMTDKDEASYDSTPSCNMRPYQAFPFELVETFWSRIGESS